MVKCVFVYVYVVVCGLFPPLYMSSTDVVPISTGNSVLDSFLAVMSLKNLSDRLDDLTG